MLQIKELSDYDFFQMKESILFNGLEEVQLRMIEKAVKIFEYSRNELVFKEKSNSVDLYLVIRGKVEVFKTDKNKENHTVSVVEPGDFVGEMAFITGCCRTASVKTINDTRFITINPEKFKNVLLDENEIKYVVLNNVAKKIALNLEILRQDYTKLIADQGAFFKEHHQKNLKDLTNNISMIRSRYLRR